MESAAVKILNCPRAFDKLKPRQELELLQELHHPNILRLIGAYEDDDIFIQVFEFLRQSISRSVGLSYNHDYSNHQNGVIPKT